MEFKPQLKPFVRRIRTLRAWQGAGIGACVGAGASLGWAVLDWARISYTDWVWMGGLVIGGAALGGLFNALRPLAEDAVSKSVDRRAGLEDRLVTANERKDSADSFDEAVRQDALKNLDGLEAKRIYPVKTGRTHIAALVLAVMASGVFLLGNTPLLKSASAKAEQAELKKEAMNIERLRKETVDSPGEKDVTEEERKLAEELRKLQKDLEKARMTKEEAMQKSNEIQKKADELEQKSAEQMKENLQKAESMMQRMEKAALEKAGLDKVDPSMAQMSDSERSDAMARAEREKTAAEKSLADAQKRLDDINKALAQKGLSEAEKKALEQAAKEAQKAMKDAQMKAESAKQQMDGLKLSKEAMDIIKKMQNDPLWKEIQEAARKLQQAQQDAAKKGQQPKLSKEELEEMKKQFEEFLKQFKDDAAMQAYLKELLEAIKSGKCNGNCKKIGFKMGMGGLGLGGPGAPSMDVWMGDNGRINKLDKPVKSEGKTNLSFSPTQRDQSRPGVEIYTEIKAPTTIGNRSSIPYNKVLPSYKQKAESAIRRSQIPKEHQNRVKQYFDSLGK